ncbi:hypothetical protein HRI_001583600 [Hibiscus trionum]|uniref:Uncharacterized protein n=1 Tax=Hibiscus trionum TaxID=183268 RepID=A0A9W7LWJ3_HIBTR|nr:hypothetical protein HRI_001583600 [Hibiscus trionum]
MGCSLFACFSACKNKRHKHSVDGASSVDQKHEANYEAVLSNKEEDFWKPFNPIILKKEKLGELLNNSGKKMVAFDLNVETREELPVESSDKLLKNEENEEAEGTVKGSGCSGLDLSASTVVCKPQNNRYQNSAESEEELKDLDLEINDGNEVGIAEAKNEAQLDIEESSESLFSLSIESRKLVCEFESDEKEVSSPMPVVLNRNAKDEGDQFVQSVLHPVENLPHRKGVKAKASSPLKNEEKENINLVEGFNIPISPEPDFKLGTSSSKLCSNGKKLVGQEIAVDTSLSSWLVGLENTPNSKGSTNSVGNSAASRKTNSPSYEDRPILGALTVEDLKHHSASNSSRKCRSRSPDETPIIGTVGSYWSHTGQIVDTDSSSPRKGALRTRSRNTQEERLRWNAIPFEVRLEGALDTGIAGV